MGVRRENPERVGGRQTGPDVGDKTGQSPGLRPDREQDGGGRRTRFQRKDCEFDPGIC